MPLIKMHLRNIFILDEYRSTLVPLQVMKHGRSDHVVIYLKNNIFILGGCDN